MSTERNFICPSCDGDGVATCNNPDHGFINAVGGELGRLGCPCCGHDPNFKIKGEKCDLCNGEGRVSRNVADKFIEENGQSDYLLNKIS